MMRRLVYFSLLLMVIGLVVVSVRIALQKAESRQREEQVRARLSDWHRQIALELHPSKQQQWEESAKRVPIDLLRCCTAERPLPETELPDNE